MATPEGPARYSLPAKTAAVVGIPAAPTGSKDGLLAATTGSSVNASELSRETCERAARSVRSKRRRAMQVKASTARAIAAERPSAVLRIEIASMLQTLKTTTL